MTYYDKELCLASQFRVACSMAKVDRRKVSKFISRHGEPAPSQFAISKIKRLLNEQELCDVKIPECVDDILEFPKPSPHYPMHWNRDLTMELFSSHMWGYEGDWYAQRKYY